MSTILSNAFSLNMLAAFPVNVQATEITVQTAKDILAANPFISIIGHADTASQLTGLVGMPIAFNRTTVKLSPGDNLVVAQYNGPRLPEGTTSLPTGATFRFFLLTFK